LDFDPRASLWRRSRRLSFKTTEFARRRPHPGRPRDPGSAEEHGGHDPGIEGGTKDQPGRDGRSPRGFRAGTLSQLRGTRDRAGPGGLLHEERVCQRRRVCGTHVSASTPALGDGKRRPLREQRAGLQRLHQIQTGGPQTPDRFQIDPRTPQRRRLFDRSEELRQAF